MKLETKTIVLVLALSVAVLGAPEPASAVNLVTSVAPIYQVGTGSSVNIGHTAIASTNYNRLFAGGTYSAACGAPGVVPVTGQRFLSTENMFGGLQLYVTIPERHPAIVNMPGFYEAATRGQTLNCAYNWTSRAVEGGYTIGAGGISFQTGNGERSEGGSQIFTMRIPGIADEDEWTSCIP